MPVAGRVGHAMSPDNREKRGSISKGGNTNEGAGLFLCIVKRGRANRSAMLTHGYLRCCLSPFALSLSLCFLSLWCGVLWFAISSSGGVIGPRKIYFHR